MFWGEKKNATSDSEPCLLRANALVSYNPLYQYEQRLVPWSMYVYIGLLGLFVHASARSRLGTNDSRASHVLQSPVQSTRDGT